MNKPALPLPFAGLPIRFRLGLMAAFLLGLGYLLMAPFTHGIAHAALKGSGVAVLALASLQAPVSGARWLAAIMALGAVGDVLLALPGLFMAGAASFAAGHVVAIRFYAQHRRNVGLVDQVIAAALILWGLAMPPLLARAGQPVGLAMVYAVLVTGMAASLWLSRFPRLAPIGAFCFVMSDTLLVMHLGGGALFGPAVDDALVWALYFGGQWLITLGVARGLLARAAHAG